MTTGERCATCQFFLPQTDTGGQCRRHAQQTVTWSDRNHHTGDVITSTYFDWPAMGVDQWCGDWQGAERITIVQNGDAAR